MKAQILKINNVIAKEKKLLLSKLLGNPVFLIKHMPSLSNIVSAKFDHMMAVNKKHPHILNKIRPPWFPISMIERQTCKRNGNELHIGIPFRSECSINDEDLNKNIIYKMSFGIEESILTPIDKYTDPEDYMSINRWAWLLDFVFQPDDKQLSFKRTLDKWIQDKKDKTDLSWETYSTCERVSNLLNYLSLFPEADRIKAAPKDMRDFLTDSTLWILSTMEYYGNSETGNHILNNARALVMASVALQDERLFEAGMSTFERMLPKLVLPGGFLRERSSHYQLIVLGWVLDSLFFAKHFNESRCNVLKRYGRIMAEAAGLLCDRGGNLLAFIGDVSPDISPCNSSFYLRLLHPDVWPVREVETVPYGCVDDWYWLKETDNVVLANFPSGEFPMGYPTHGHCDISGFVWIHGGRQILCDSGRYRYTKDNISVYQRSSSGHNAPTVNGLSPTCAYLTNGTWLPVPYSKATLNANFSLQNTLSMSHDGFSRATSVTYHHREIYLSGDTLFVNDIFEGKGYVTVSLHWLFGIGFRKYGNDELTVLSDNLQVNISIVNNNAGFNAKWHSEQPDCGWFSDTYGMVTPITALDLEFRVSLPFTNKTSFNISHVRN